jgi:hypothetical protein
MQRVESLFPEISVVRKPRIDLSQRFRAKPIDAALPTLFDVDEVGLEQHAQVP